MSPIDSFPIQYIPIRTFGLAQAPTEFQFYVDDFIARSNVQIADHLSRQRLLPVSSSRTVKISRKRSRNVFENPQ